VTGRVVPADVIGRAGTPASSASPSFLWRGTERMAFDAAVQHTRGNIASLKIAA